MNKKMFLRVTRYAVFCFIFLAYPAGCAYVEKGKAETGIVLGTFTVDAGDYDRINTPIRFQCSPPVIFGDPSIFRRPGHYHYIDDGADLALLRNYHLTLVEQGGSGARLPVQWLGKADFAWAKASQKGTLVWILDGKTPKNSSRIFKLVLEKGAPAAGHFTVEDINNKSLLVKSDGRAVLRYNYGIIQHTEGKNGPYDRGSYIHPVWTPAGKIITGDFSPEHIHQRGIFFAWTEAIFGEIETGFWSLGESAGRILADDFGPSVIDGPVFTGLVVCNKGVVAGKTYFKEIWVVKLYALGEEGLWLFDVYVRQVPTNPEKPEKILRLDAITAPTPLPTESQKPQTSPPGGSILMVLPKVYYGGMAFRGTSEWLGSDSRDVARAIKRGVEFKDTEWLAPGVSLDVLTDQGGDRKSGDRSAARWIDYTGPLGGAGNNWGGVVMFDHPSNPHYPTPLRVHPDLPYFCYAFTQNQPYIISSNEPLNLIYRFLVHNGHPQQQVNERFARDFTEPPKVSWQRLE
jgi:hypothetical protein